MSQTSSQRNPSDLDRWKNNEVMWVICGKCLASLIHKASRGNKAGILTFEFGSNGIPHRPRVLEPDLDTQSADVNVNGKKLWDISLAVNQRKLNRNLSFWGTEACHGIFWVSRISCRIFQGYSVFPAPTLSYSFFWDICRFTPNCKKVQRFYSAFIQFSEWHCLVKVWYG